MGVKAQLQATLIAVVLHVEESLEQMYKRFRDLSLLRKMHTCKNTYTYIRIHYMTRL